MLIIGKKKEKKTIALDFDGVLHDYTKGWTGIIPEGKPIPGSLDFVKKILSMNYNIIVFSARLSEKNSYKEMKKWLKEYDFPDLELSNEKPNAEIYIDDRGYRFDGNFKNALDYIKPEKMKPWYKE